jgi:hypothetical protein
MEGINYMEILKQFFLLLVFAIIIMGAYNVLKIFVFSKIKININKWFVLAAAIVVFIISIFTAAFVHPIFNYVFAGLFMILFLWFLDLTGFNSRRTKTKEITIKPKAKPNRVKNKK